MWAKSTHHTNINYSIAPGLINSTAVSKGPHFLQKHCPEKFSSYRPADASMDWLLDV